MGVDVTTQDTGSWDVEFVIKQGANATTTSIVGSPYINLIAADTAFAQLPINITADTVNGGVEISINNTWINNAYWEANLSVTELVIPAL